MRTALSIFRRDIRRIMRSPVAVIVTVGVCIIPSLYAWINILANRDPYTNTSTMPVAVVIEDEGAQIPGMGNINAGSMVRDRLAENDQLAWTFVHEEQAALDGVRAGTYYAAFVIPSNFTASLARVLDGDADPAHISYYVNEKANAIAPKVTDTGATELETQIANEFTRVASEAVSERLGAAARSFTTETQTAHEALGNSIEDASTLLNDLADTLDDAGIAIASSREAVAEASATLDDLGSASQRLSNNLDSALEDLGTTREHAQTSLTSLSQALNEGASSIAGIAASGSYDIGAIAGDIGWAQGKLDGALSEIRASLGTLASLKETLQQVRDEIAGVAPETDAAKSAQEDILAMLDDAITSLDAFTQTQTAALDRLQAAADNIAAGAENARGLSSAIAEAASAGAEGLSDLSSALASTTLPELSHALDSFAQAGGSAQTGAASASSMIEQARGTLSSLDAVLEQAGAAVSATAEGLRTSARTLSTVARDLDALSSAWTLQELEELGNIDPDDIASIMAEPVALDAQPVFPVANYGSGVAPFYTNLALWVGGFVLIAIYKLEVDGEGIDSATPRDAFFGRWLLIVTIGMVQALICCTGDVLIGVQCASPLAYVAAGIVESFVYVSIVFSLAIAFKHVGKALGVLLVVLQIPGAAGTYPIEMMPGFFQVIHPWLPFTYGIAAMREAVAGFYGYTYAASIAALLAFLAPAAIVGLGLRSHLVSLGALFDRRLAETDFMVSDHRGIASGTRGMERLAKMLLIEPEARRRVQMRASRYLQTYPRLLKRGVAALVVIPIVLLALMCILHRTFDLLMLWVCSLTVISAYLVAVEYLRDRALRIELLAQLKPHTLRRLARSGRKAGTR